MALGEKVFGIERPLWTAPDQDGEGPITSYLSSTVAVEKTGSGARMLVESSVPLRSAVGSGRLAPTSLSLQEREGRFVPANPVVPVSISKTPDGGVSLPLEVSVAPVQAATPEAPSLVGDGVVYPGTATDTDFMVQAIPGGVETSWQLRSEHSPGEDGLAFKLPAGASLQLSKTTPGTAEIVREGQTLDLMPAAVAIQADGTPLATSYTVDGDTLVTHVDLSGSVDFPVLVDPIIVASDGSYGAGTWTGWNHYDNCSGCTITKETSSLLEVGMNPGPANGTWGQWNIWAPGAGKEGGASIERVDITGVNHQASGQSYFVGYIYKSNGSKRVWTFNGAEGAQGEGALYDGNALAGSSIAFCAQGAGGKDGGTQPLCNESYGGEAFTFEDELGPNSRTVYNYSSLTGASVKFLDTTAPNVVKLEPTFEKWSQHGPTDEYIHGEDQGVGLEALSMEIPPGHTNEQGQPFFVDKEHESCAANNGFDGCPKSFSSGALYYGELATGAYTLGVYAYDAVGNVREEQPDPKLYIDHTAPTIALKGKLQEANGGAIGEGLYNLEVSAEDGNSGAPQSGVRAISIYVDGTKANERTTSCAEPKGIPLESCFGLLNGWMFNAQTYGSGSHTITVKAKDWAGNESSQTIQVTVNVASSQAVGPGSVNLNTGDYKLSAVDVAMASANAALSVSRTYDSRNVSQGATGPLGAPWQMNLPNSMWQSLKPKPDGSVVGTTVTGMSVVFASNGNGGFVSPTGYQTLTLSEPSKSPVEYRMTEASGAATIFTFAGTVEEPKGEEETEEVSLYEPSGVVQPGGSAGINKVTYLFTKTAEGIVEPTEVLAPEPSSGACTSTLVKGCRALTFNYASSTTATGEKQSEWGDYKGHLTRVYFTAWNPAKSEMTTETIAQYSYDTHGHLRSEWDPRISPALKTVYGYDAEGHVTAVTAPGQETWAFTYGAISGDAATGRLIGVTQAPATAPLWAGEGPQSTEAPTVTGSAILSNKLSVSTGKWSGAPVAYGYQWEDCNAQEKECVPIQGATNPTYKLLESDNGHTLSVIVTATNGGGSATVTATEPVVVGATFAPVYSSSFGTEGTGAGQFKSPMGIALDSKGNSWVVDTGNNRVEEFNEKSEYVKSFGSTGTGNGQFKGPEGIAIGAGNTIWVADRENHRIEEFNEKGEYLRQATGGGSGEKLESPSGVAIIESKVWVTDSTWNQLYVFSETGTYERYWYGSGSDKMNSPHGIVYWKGLKWVADSMNNRAVGYGKEGENFKEIESEGGIGASGSSAGQFKLPMGIAADSKGDLWIADTENNRVQEFGEVGGLTNRYMTQFGAYGSGTGQLSFPQAVTVDSKGNVFVADTHNNRIEKWVPSTSTVKEGEAVPAPAPRWTVEYKVPTSGSGAPYSLSETELAKWRQNDTPASSAGTAIFPPDETVGWPASDYRRATIYYLDSSERTVDVAIPSGGIAVAEYNSHNNQTRSLTADNRATALKEANTGEAAEHLSTTSSYNSEGTELLSTLGPEHKVKLPSGSEVQARKQVNYSYDEGAPTEGGPYRLVTKTTEAALVAGKEEDKRTVTTSYAGQENLGWKLRKPTSTTVAPGGRNLVRSTVYNANTGDPTETKVPGSFAKASGGASYLSQFASAGSSTGQISNSWDIAVDSSGNVWIADTGNNRVEEFNAEGAYQRMWGSSGTENGQFKSPEGIAIDSKGYVWVADTGNNRIQEFNAQGTFVRTFGTSGTGNGQLKCPEGLATDKSNDVWVADKCNNRIEEFTSEGSFVRTVTHEMSSPGDVTIDPKENVWVADTGNSRIEEFKINGEYVRQFGKKGTGNGEFTLPWRLGIGPEENVWVTDSSNNRVQVLTQSGEYKGQFGSIGTGSGQFSGPTGIEFNGYTAYVLDRGNNRVQKWAIESEAQGNTGAYVSQVIYYTPSTEASVVACQNHPEWAALPCQTQPAHQSEVSGTPSIPVTTFTYNTWDEPETVKSTSAESSRVETDNYDSAGRLTSKEPTSTTGTTLPKVSYQYNSETGLLTKQSTGSGSEEKKIESEYNRTGHMVLYTDADSASTTFEYEKEGDERLLKTTDPKGTQTLKYDTTTGLLAELTDTAAGTFKAGYDVGGNQISESLPNGMSETRTLNNAGEQVSLEYTKTTHCTEACKWFTDSVVPSIHGQWMSQSSTLSSSTYAYNEAGWLTQVQNTPAGKGCTTRVYGLDADANRTSLTSRPPGTGGACATEGGETERHKYDTADRLIDSGIAYDPFGDVTSLPATDAGGWTLTSSYYTDGQLQSETQNGQTIGYQLDPARRTREIVSTGKASSDAIDHYDGSGTAPSWTSYTSGEWLRNIAGIEGGLAATQTNTETPVIQIANLHGDIVATVPDSETATKLSSAVDTSEYGVPTVTEPPRYSWLGAGDFPTELASGVMAMGARSYVPQLGRFLQPDPQPGGSANVYTYTRGNPLNEADPSGEWTLGQESGGVSAVATGEGEQLTGGTGVAQGAIMPAPVNAQMEEAFLAAPPWDQVTAGSEEYEEYEEEGEEGTEYIAFAHAQDEPHREALVEEGLFFQPEGNTDETSHTLMIAGGCPSTKDPCWKDVKHSHYKQTKGYSCRSGGSRDSRGRCKPGRAKGSNGGAEVCGALGGFAGAAVGTAVGGAGGGLVGGAIGGEAGSKACGG